MSKRSASKGAVAKWQRGGLQNRYTRVRSPPAPPAMMKIALKPFLLFVGIFVLSAAGFFVFKNFKTLPQKASLLIETPETPAQVFLDDLALDQSPLQKDDLSAGEYTLKLISGEQVYQTKIELLGGTQTVVRREFGPSDTFSGGEVLWFEKSQGPATISITSDPDGVQVKIDGKDFGKTPLLIEDIEAGTHDLYLSLENFETRKINIKTEGGYQLRISSKLALNPLPHGEVKEMDFGGEKVVVYNLSPTGTLFVDADSFKKGIIYWIKTRGLGAGQIKLNYFVDVEGKIFDAEGKIFDANAFDGEQTETVTVGFLGNADDEVLSDQAKTFLTLLTTKILKTPPLVDKVKILSTGVGWLRVRSEPSLSGAEVTKINVGEKFLVLEEKTGWVKIKLSDGGEGWVSADFVEKIQEAP